MRGCRPPFRQLQRALRVALVSNSAFGESASRLRWAVLLRERGLAPRFTLPCGDDETVEFIEARGIGVDRYPLERLSPGLGNGMRSIAALTRIFREGRFDVVHTFAHEPNLYGASSTASTKSKAALVKDDIRELSGGPSAEIR